MELYVTARHFDQSPDLYGPIEMRNPATAHVTTAFAKAAREVAEIIGSGDRERFRGQVEMLADAGRNAVVAVPVRRIQEPLPDAREKAHAGLAQGIVFERRLFHGLFGTEDQKEGMAAFVAKRAAKFKHK